MDKKLEKFIVENLIMEKPNSENHTLLIEERFSPCELITEKDAYGNRKLYIQGVFSEFDVKNQNGRIYPRHVMEPEVKRFFEKYVKENRALGELDHPEDSTINLENVAHRIVNLWIEGNKVMGKALIGGPKGDAVKKIFNELGGRLGVSSRSLGNINYKNEVSDLQIITWDIVHEPSVAIAMVDSLTESKDYGKQFNWLNDKSGFVTENLKNQLKIINNNMLLENAEKLEYARFYIEEFFKNLYPY